MERGSKEDVPKRSSKVPKHPMTGEGGGHNKRQKTCPTRRWRKQNERKVADKKKDGRPFPMEGDDNGARERGVKKGTAKIVEKRTFGQLRGCGKESHGGEGGGDRKKMCT